MIYFSMNNNITITIIGTGYVGLVSGACLADIGNKVICLDFDNQKIESIREGKIPFYEPGLSTLVKDNIQKKKLSFSSCYNNCCESDVYFICVDTPDDGTGKSDLKNFNKVIDSLAENLSKDSLIVTKSTVPLGTNKYLEEILLKKIKNKNINLSFASNPEFLREGNAINDFMQPDRIVVGCREKEKKVFEKMYSSLSEKLMFVSSESAEIIKYAANSFLATKISFINEIANLVDITGGNIHEVKKGVGSDKRIGMQFLNAGIGFGGSCFPKDVNSLLNTQRNFGLGEGILERTLQINNNQYKFLTKKIFKFFSGNTKDINCYIWGLAFKGDTDDIRESVSIKIIKEISPNFNKIYAYDPQAIKNSKEALENLDNLVFTKDKYDQIESCSLLVIASEWDEFKEIDLLELKKIGIDVIFDGKNILDKEQVENTGIQYFGVGN